MTKKNRSWIARLLLSLQVFVSCFGPLSPLMTTALAATQEETVSESIFSYQAGEHQLAYAASDPAKYSFYYQFGGVTQNQTGELTEAGQHSFQLGTQSETDFISHDFSRLVFKVQTGEKITSYWLTKSADQVTIKETESAENLDLADAEKEWLIWDVDQDQHQAVTLDPVAIGESYTFPLNKEVKIQFTKLPSEPSAMTITEIELDQELAAALGNAKAYDITTQMTDGEFEFDLTLPKPAEMADAEVIYADDVEELAEQVVADQEQPAVVAEEQVEVTAQEVVVTGLDHLTVFVVVAQPTKPDYLQIIVDNGDAEYSEIGSWSDSTSCASAAYGNDGRYATSGSGKNATWKFQVPESGNYQLDLTWVSYSTQATNASYQVIKASDSSVLGNFTINQRGGNCDFHDFTNQGVFTLDSGEEYQVVLSAQGADGNVFADAARLERVTAPAEVWVDDDWASQTSGTDLGSGKIFGWNAFAEIQTAIDQVAAAGTVYVAAGSYPLSTAIKINKDGLKLIGPQANVDPRPSKSSSRSSGTNEAVIDGQSAINTLIDINANDVEVNGFEIKSGKGDLVLQTNAHSGTKVTYSIVHDGNGDEGVQLKKCTSCLLSYNYVYDIAYPGDGLNFADSTDCTIDNNELTDISTDNAAIYIYGSNNSIISNNYVHQIPKGEGIKLGAKNGDDAGKTGGQIVNNVLDTIGDLSNSGDNNDDAIAVYTSQVLVDGNEISRNYSENGALYLSYAITDITITNNNFHDNQLDDNKYSNVAAILVYSNVDAANVKINDNSFVNNTPYGVTNLASSNLDATNNYWGDDSGPAGEGPGTGDKVSAKVDYCPWRDSAGQLKGSCLVEVQGRKFADQDMNGYQNGSEPGIKDWSISLYDSSWSLVKSMKTGDDSTEAGNVEDDQYRFVNLAKNSTYFVCEERNGSYLQTSPELGSYPLNTSGSVQHQDALAVTNVSTNKNNEGAACWQVTTGNSGDQIGWLKFGNIQLPDLSTPTQTGYNENNGDSYDLPQPPEIACRGYTAINSISDHWSRISTGIAEFDAFIKYQRQYQTPSMIESNNWSGNEIYSQPYSDYRQFSNSAGVEGTYNSRTRAFYDLNGNNQLDSTEKTSGWSSDNGNCYITFDKTGPTKPEKIWFENPSLSCDGITNASSVTVKWNDSVDNIAGYEYVINYPNGAVRSEWSPSNLFTVAQLNEGTSYIKVQAVDVLGRTSDWSDECAITLDTIAPQFDLDGIKYSNGSVVNFFKTNDNQPTLVGSVIDSPDVATIKLTVNGVTYDATITGSDWEAKIANILADGTYPMTIVATDGAGNSTTLNQDLTIDTVAPRANHTFYKDGTAITDSIAYVNHVSQLTFTGEYEDATPSSGLYWDSFVIFEAQDDGSFRFSQNGKKSFCGWRSYPNLVDIGSGSTYSLTAARNFTDCEESLIDGEYYLAHHIYDEATRKDKPSIKQFRDVLGLHFMVDTVKPTSTIDVPANETNFDTVYLNAWDGSIAGTASDADSGIAQVHLSIKKTVAGMADEYWNGSAWQASEATVAATLADEVVNWTYQLPNPQVDATYVIVSKAEDKAGNIENTYQLTVIFDVTIPEITVTVDPTEPDGSDDWYVTRPVLTLTANDNFVVDKIEYQWDSLAGSWLTYIEPLATPSEGTHTLYYRAIDKAGNVSSDTGKKTVKWDQTDFADQSLSVSVSPNPTSGSTATVSWELVDDNVGVDHYKVVWSLNGSSTSYSKSVGADKDETEIDRLEEGTWKVQVIAYDGAGHHIDDDTSLIVDRTAPAAPVLTLTGTGAGSADLSWTSVADANAYIIYYGVESGQYLYSANVGNVTSYTVQGLTAGSYYFIVRAMDKSSNQSPNSNEVSTGTIAGAPGAVAGPAQGFGEVAGATTEEETTPAGVAQVQAAEGQVAGVSTECRPLTMNLPWILLIAQAILLLAIEFWQRRGPTGRKLLMGLVMSAICTAAFYAFRECNCYETANLASWLCKWYWVAAVAVFGLIKLIGYGFIEAVEKED